MPPLKNAGSVLLLRFCYTVHYYVHIEYLHCCWLEMMRLKFGLNFISGVGGVYQLAKL